MSTNIWAILGSQVYNASYESIPHLTSHFILAPSLEVFFLSIHNSNKNPPKGNRTTLSPVVSSWHRSALTLDTSHC